MTSLRPDKKETFFCLPGNIHYKKKKASSSKTVDKFLFDFNTRRTRPGSAHLFEDSDDREDSPSKVKPKTTKLKDLTIADSRNDTASLRLNVIFNTPTNFERAHKITRGLGFETISEITTEKSRMAQPPVTRIPTLNHPPFDGDGQNADR
ncbi:hypothetical protein Golomagni_02244 [Golovinomyces magnicellulatus]|nr:hypothetical protein Golomagni_02244 [Golovinomyces magnicellulatus]